MIPPNLPAGRQVRPFGFGRNSQGILPLYYRPSARWQDAGETQGRSRLATAPPTRRARGLEMG